MSFFKKIVNKILNQSDEDDAANVTKLGDELRNADLDYKFAQLFTHSGGYFNYCADSREALQTLNQIVKVEDIKSVFCWEEQLQKFLDVININYTPKVISSNDAVFITCDYLIAFDGKIMLSYDNILNYGAYNLPDKIIIIANVSQIIKDLPEGMMKNKRSGKTKNITSISAGNSTVSSDKVKNKKLFLLLLEE